MSTKNEDGLAAKVRGLEERVTELEIQVGIAHGPTGVEILAKKKADMAARNAAASTPTAAEIAAQKKIDDERKARKLAELKKPAAKVVAMIAILFGLCIGAQAQETRSWTLYSGTNDLVVPGTLTVTGNCTVVGTITAGFTNLVVSSMTSTNFVGNGANVTNLAGGNIASGNIGLARITNAVSTTSGVKLTNDVLVAGGGTNRWIMVPLGTKYLVESITGL